MVNLLKRKKILSWFKYHHNSTNSAQESHGNFISKLSKLESLSDTICDEIDSNAQWTAIRNAIYSLNEEQIDLLFLKIKR